MKMNVKRLLALVIMIAGLMSEAPLDARRGGGGRGGRGGGGMRGGRGGGGMRRGGGGGRRGGGGRGGMRRGGGGGRRGGRGMRSGRGRHHRGGRGRHRHGGRGRHHRHGGRGYRRGYYGGRGYGYGGYGGYYGGYYPWWGLGYYGPYYGGGTTYVNEGNQYLTDDAGLAYWTVRNSSPMPIYVSTSGSDRIYIRPGGNARLYHPNSFYFTVEANGRTQSLYSQTHNVNIIQDGAGNFVIGYH